MPFKKLFKSARKRVKKLIPKEIRPFIPYIAAAMGPAGLASSGIFSNPAVTKALIAGGTRFATDDEADLKDIGITAALAAAPAAAEQFSTAGEAAKLKFGDPGFFKQQAQLGASKVAGFAKDKPLTTMGIQAGTDAAVKQIELDQKALEEYEADLLSRGIKNKAARRNAIFNVFINAGYGDDEVNSMLDSYGYAVGGKVKKKETPSAGIMTIETDAEVNDDNGEEEMSMEEFVEMMKGGKDDEVSIDDSLSYAQQGLGMLQGDVKPMPMMRFADGGFGGITEAVETIEEKPKEFLVDKLKVTQQPGQSEMRAIIEAMYNDIDGVMPDDRKNEFYELYAPQMYRNGEMDKSEFEFIQTEILDKEVPKMKEGGIMNLGGKEMDLRSGGFVPIGKKERADDVPARLSKNEFVMTADAVRAAGGGSVNKGAKRMYDLMNNLEARV
tara:strand:- start:49 stop:1371 length:1323 start_codon:yes stop_codon:yes gene_type:complete